ncbi:MAG: DUF421 domain-containing protein [Clostridia bacterium]|nr:DUF421 domain-containing protein [Clostridia bacterium]
MLLPLFRTLILYAALSAAMRLLGKRQIGEMEPQEFVTTLLISEVASVPMQDVDIPLLHGLAPVAILILTEYLLSLLALKRRRLRLVFAGKPELVVREGKILEKTLRKNRVTLDELLIRLREAGENDVTALKYVILETDGTLSVVKNGGEEGRDGLFRLLIAEGKINKSELKDAGRDEKWLRSAAKERGLGIREIFYFALADSGRIVCQKKGEGSE